MPTVTLAPWSDEHLLLLVEANTPAMTRYLGGPESESDLQDRHRRYLRAWNDGSAWMYAIEVDGERAGGVGFWPIDHDGEPAYETGWNVLPRWQGKGVARQALLTLISKVPHEAPPRNRLFAYPSIENEASNGLCRSVGFIDQGERNFPYRDTVLRTRAWAFKLDNQG